MTKTIEELTKEIKELEEKLKKEYKNAIENAKKQCKDDYKKSYNELIKPLKAELHNERQKGYYKKYYTPIKKISQRNKNAIKMFDKKFNDLNKEEQNKVKAKIKREYLQRIRATND